MSLKIYLPLNENMKNVGFDKVSMPQESATYVDGVNGKCLSLNGSTFYTISGITLGDEASFTYWSKTSTSGKMVWVLRSDATPLLCCYTSSFYTLNTGDSNNNPFKTPSNENVSVYLDDAWHHFVITWGNGVSKLYIDGEYKGTALEFRSPKTTDGTLALGGGYNNAHQYDWNGLIDDFRVYDNCLSDADANRLYLNTRNELIVHLTFDKDLRNIGSSNIKFTNHGSTFNDNGGHKCRYFDGNKQWIQFDQTLGNYYNNDFSVCFWVNPEDSTRGIILSEWQGTGASNIAIEILASPARVVRLYWNGSPDIQFSAAGALALNAWTHVSITKQGRVVKIYFNGVLKQTYTNSTDFPVRTSDCQPRIGDDYRGNSSNTVSFKGYLDDFRMYTIALSELDIQRIYGNKHEYLALSFPFKKNFRNVGLSNARTEVLGEAEIISFNDSFGCLSAGGPTNSSNAVKCSTNFLKEFNEGNDIHCISASAWIMPKGTHPSYNGTIISAGNWDTTNGRWSFGVSQNNTSVDVFGPRNNTYITCSVPVDEWTHLISIYDDSNKIGKLYKNGEYVSSYNFNSSDVFSASTDFSTIAKAAYGSYFNFNGYISDLKLYNLELTEADIERIYNERDKGEMDFYNNYEPLTYIQSTGTQYIDTLINPKVMPRAIVKMAIINNADKDYWGNNNTNGSAYIANFAGYNLKYYRYGTTGYTNVGNTVKQNSIHVWDVSKKVFVDGVINKTMSGTYKYNASQATIQIFKAARATYYASFRLYYFKLYDGEELCRDFIPAKRKSDSVVGLYDKVSNTFFTNKGTGTFTYA